MVFHAEPIGPTFTVVSQQAHLQEAALAVIALSLGLMPAPPTGPNRGLALTQSPTDVRPQAPQQTPPEPPSVTRLAAWTPSRGRSALTFRSLPVTVNLPQYNELTHSAAQTTMQENSTS